MREWTTACTDWEERIVEGKSLISSPPIFEEQAELALRIFKALRLVDVAGSPRIGEVSRQWIYDFVGAIFGAYDAETGQRLITEFFLLISKKNAKSTISAGVMLTALILNWRKDAEFFIIAPTVEVANNSFKPAKAMVKADPELSAMLQVQEHVRTIKHLGTGATLKIISADSDVVSGIKGTGVLIEELWLFGKRLKAADMLTEAKGGLAARPEGFVIYLSTHSDEPPAGVFAAMLKRGRDVRDGKLEQPAFLPVIYEFPKKMLEDKSYREPENFYITNPNMGASVDERFLLNEWQIAKSTDEIAERRFLAKHLNVPITMALTHDSWSGADIWEKNAVAGLKTLDDLLELSEVVTIGIDGGGNDDLLGVAVVGRYKDDPKIWLHWATAFAHPIALKRQQSIASRLKDFERAGEFVIVDRVGDDTEMVADIVRRCHESGLLDRVGLDPAGVGMIVDAITEQLGENDADGKIVAVSQGWRLGGAVKTVERKLAENAFKHGGLALMDWTVANARVEARANGIVITKAASGWAKIDALMATFDAVDLMARNPAARSARRIDDFLNNFVIG